MATINLAPGTQYLAAARRRRRLLFSGTALLVIVLIIVGVVLELLTTAAARQLRLVEEELRGVETEIAALGPDVERITLFEQRLAALDGLLSNHLSWTPFFKDLERLLPAPAVIGKLSVELESGIVAISAVAPNIDDVAQTIASLATSPNRLTIFKEANLHNITRRETPIPDSPQVDVVYSFDLSLPFDTQALKTRAN